MMLLDEATSAMDTHTQRRAADGIASEQKRLGFSVVQVAHRIETLSHSDVLYFVENGKVVEVGGLETLNGTAIEELCSWDIEYAKVVNPETGNIEERLVRGFYRQLHEAYYDLNFHNMDASQLVKKVRTLEEQLNRAKAEKESKLGRLRGKLPPPLPLEKAVTDQQPSCREVALRTHARDELESTVADSPRSTLTSASAHDILPPLVFQRFWSAA